MQKKEGEISVGLCVFSFQKKPDVSGLIEHRKVKNENFFFVFDS